MVCKNCENCNCSWKTRELKSEGQLSIDSSGFRNMHISAGLGGSFLEAKGGIVSAMMQVDELRAQSKSISQCSYNRVGASEYHHGI